MKARKGKRMVNSSMKGPKKTKQEDFWDNYEDELGEYSDYEDLEEDDNDGEWEDYED